MPEESNQVQQVVNWCSFWAQKPTLWI
jgi:hypothetical protein